MQFIKLNIKAIGVIFMLLAFTNGSYAQCDYTDDITVSSSGGTSADANYTQLFILTDGGGNRIIDTSSTGAFTGLDAGNYFVYAYNYENANVPDPLPAPEGNISQLGENERGCATLSQALQGRAVRVCEGTNGCEAAPYTVSTSGENAAAGYTQNFILVCADTIVAAELNTTSASFDLPSLGVSAGDNCQAYAVNFGTANGEAPPTFDVGTAFPNEVGGDCLDYIGQDIEIAATGSTVCNLILPLNLLYFKGHSENRSNILEWRVTDENEVDFHEVQRSDDGINFFPIGIKQAMNEGEGNVTDYKLTDRDVEPGTKYYYRLRMVENTGEFNFSNIIILYQTIDDKLTILGAEPNPALSTANIAFIIDSEKEVQYMITDLLGRKLITGRVETVRGYNKMSIDVSNLSSAPYIITIFKEGERASERFIKR